MSVDSVCNDFDEDISDSRLARGGFYTATEWAIRIDKGIVTGTIDMPGTTFMEKVRYHTQSNVMRARYRLMMFGLRKEHPNIYNFITSQGVSGIYFGIDEDSR